MMQTLDDYILEHIDAEPEFLHTLDRDTHLYHLRPRMCSGHLQGRILKMLVRMIRPRRILELGTFTGYSALCLAEGMPESSELHTIEIDDELEDFIRSHFDSSEFADRLHLHIGDAKEILASMSDVKFDLVFMDANKREYCEYYDLVFPMLEEGGFIIADNTLWDGHVVDESHLKDAQTQGIVRFNKMVAMDDCVEKVILPIRDGLTLIRKRLKCEL